MAWRTRLRELILGGSIRTQAEIVAALAAEGVDVNQGTVSRELQAMSAVKIDGVYRLPPPPELPAPVHRVELTAGDCVGVVHTDSAFASVIGQFLDDAAFDGLLGTLAGDNTVFVALSGPDAADRLLRLLGHGRRRPDGGRARRRRA